MSTREQAVQLIQEIPESEMNYVIWFLRSIVVPDKKPDAQAVNRLIKDLDIAKERADREGWISEEEFFEKHGVIE